MENVPPEEDCAAPGRRSASHVGEQLTGIRWERFLPRRFLRVLLVEHDDSTRHIVAALLRKCSYHVSAVADGRKAWELMMETCYNFDLVLTEFEMPLLSGIGLLSQIVGTEDSKSIPVIMMSSQDSIGIVHKCMLKGAADFLVKPLRKNELRNLWQHVWRRHCSSSYVCASENNAASNQICPNASEGSRTDETIDKESDAQSLGSEGNAEHDISQKQAEPVAKHGCPPREVEAYSEQPGNNMTAIVGSSLVQHNGVLRDCTSVGRNFAVLPVQVAPLIENIGLGSYGESRCAKGGNEKFNLLRQINSQETSSQSMSGNVKSGANGQCSNAVMSVDDTEENASSAAARSSQMNHVFNTNALPLWELSLRAQLNDSAEHHMKKNILNHSNASAFTRYVGTFSKNVDQKLNSPFICIRNSECVNHLQPFVSSLSCDNMNCSHSASRGEDMTQFQMFSDRNMDEVCGLSRNATAGEQNSFLHAQLGFIPVPLPVGATPYWSFYKGHEAQVNDTKIGEQRDMSLNHMVDVFQNDNMSRDVLKATTNNGSGEITDAAAAAATETALESPNESRIQSCSKSVTNCSHSYRETALIKFRLKRKDRCFEKKVRYHSRQKLAEQRPRVKGQFVRQMILKINATQEADG
ncbi:Two-component response regulator-like PRR95 [Platanthera zijinensis]|uniref:Two-component response regulator-like PRR95 n=1 Tax=Platanthera zijinensis TaxID=2320716 RepID=A0AAP0GBT0_9ASPA